MKKKFTIQTDKKVKNDYLQLDNKKFLKKWHSIAKRNRRNGITAKETMAQFQYEMQQAQLNIDFHHQLVNKREQQQLNNFKEKLQDFKDNFSKYVATEKVKLPERLFRRIDQLKKPLHQLQEKIQEFKNTTSIK
jgi:hypothetical protein